jgi:hypothetical protein
MQLTTQLKMSVYTLIFFNICYSIIIIIIIVPACCGARGGFLINWNVWKVVLKQLPLNLR